MPTWIMTQVEIVFPVASEAMTATGEEGAGSMQVVPGVSGVLDRWMLVAAAAAAAVFRLLLSESSDNAFVFVAAVFVGA